MMKILYKKEIKSYFASPLAYVVSALFAITCGWIFFNSIARYILDLNNAGPMGAQNIKFGPVVFQIFGNINLLLLFFVPILTMRLISEEKKLRTIDLLYSAPLSDWSLILSKYFAALTVIVFMLSTTLMFPLVLTFSGLEDYSYFISGYLGVFLNITLYTAIGLMCSSFSENQIICVVVSLVLSFFLWLITWASHTTENFYLVELYRYIGISVHFDMIRNGILELYHFFYYLNALFLCLLVTKKVLESRNW